MKTLASTLALGTLVTFMAGCAAAADDAAEANAANMTGAESAVTATVTTKEITSNIPGCSVSYQWPVVTTSNPASTAAIAKVLDAAAPVVATICKDLDGETLDQEGSYSVELNEGGLLSISFGESHYTSTMSSIGHDWYTHTFDLATGAELTLADILTPAALTKAEGDCTKEIDELFCIGRFTTKAGERQRFSLRERGLVILVSLPEEYVIDWSRLPAESFKPGPVAAWRASKK